MKHSWKNVPPLLTAGLLAAGSMLSSTAFGQTAPVIPRVAQEDLQDFRALPPSEVADELANEPNRYLQTEIADRAGIKTLGWIEAGIGGNNWGTPFNGTITFNDRNWQAMMNQLYLVNERVLDTEDGGWDVGGRIDLLYGTDYTYTTAAGLDAYNYGNYNAYFVPRWNSSKYYGLAMPQLYGEVGRDDLSVKFGHFYTIIGYEVVPAVGNFFYTICDTFQYGEPFTHTGMLATWKPDAQLTTYAGIVNGWDNWSSGTPGYTTNNSYNYFNNNAGFLGGITMKDVDEKQALTFTTYSGNMLNPTQYVPSNQAVSGNRSYISTVYTNELTDKLTYVFQNDNGWQFGLPNYAPGGSNIYTPVQGQQNGLAQWYGLVNYLFYKFSDTTTGGVRLEYFRDNNGFRVYNPLRNLNYPPNFGPAQGGYQGNFWEVTFGVNYRPSKNWVFRPELRYDWYSPDKMGGNLPYGGQIGRGGNGTEYGQFYGGGDFIYQF
jgi:hypothetical protein